MKLSCPICHSEQLRIEQQDDSVFKVIKCLGCGWWKFLGHLRRHPEEDAGYVNV